MATAICIHVNVMCQENIEITTPIPLKNVCSKCFGSPDIKTKYSSTLMIDDMCPPLIQL